MTKPRPLGMLASMSSCGVTPMAFLLVLGATACTSGVETGNPLRGELSYTGYSSEPAKYGVASGGEVLSVKNAWFALETVQVSAMGDCGLDDDAHFTVEGLGVGDHAAGRHNFTSFSASSARYCQMTLPFASVSTNSASAPVELQGHAVLLKGELADGTPFSIVSDQVPELTLQANAGGFELTPEESDAVVGFDFATWLGGIDWSAATVQDGAIALAPDSNAELLALFESNLAPGVALFRDRDGDGVLDTSPELLAAPR